MQETKQSNNFAFVHNDTMLLFHKFTKKTRSVMFMKKVMFCREFCMLVPDAGPCKETMIRYFYNEETKKCEAFQYGGCDGNENNFEVGSGSDSDNEMSYYRLLCRDGIGR